MSAFETKGHETYNSKKFLKGDWLKRVVFQRNLKYYFDISKLPKYRYRQF